MTHGSLFTGGGMFDLASEWMGWTNVFQVEIDDYCQKVLEKNFPNVQRHRDIQTTDFRIYRGIDILTGGDPCQPHSVAGKGKGKQDERYLWPEYKRAITECEPSWIVNENVPGSITNGILDEKISDLESLGYSWWPPLVIPAGVTGALHKRNRVWLVAYSERLLQSREKPCNGATGRMGREFKPVAWDRDWESALREFRRVDDGLSYKVDRIDVIRNAIVPHVAYEIFKAMQ
jgi:DNA (cytosine-5)-methyltransferase 1